VKCSKEKCAPGASCGTQRAERAWCTRDLLMADHTGAVELGADAAVLHALYGGTENIEELKEATCVPYAGVWHGRVMVKAAQRAGSGAAGGRAAGAAQRGARGAGGREAAGSGRAAGREPAQPACA
jgi:hypothetical protein